MGNFFLGSPERGVLRYRDYEFTWCAPQGENFAAKPRLSTQRTELRRLAPLWWHFDARNISIFDHTCTQNGLFSPYIGLW